MLYKIFANNGEIRVQARASADNFSKGANGKKTENYQKIPKE